MKIRRAQSYDAIDIGDGLRKADRLELEAHGWSYPYCDALFALIESSEEALTLVHRGEPIALATVHADPKHPELGWVSMLGTDEIARNPVGFVRACRSRLSFLAAGFERLVAITDARNKVHHRFLEAFGFDFLGTEEVNGLRFLRVTKYVGDGNVLSGR